MPAQSKEPIVAPAESKEQVSQPQAESYLAMLSSYYPEAEKQVKTVIITSAVVVKDVIVLTAEMGVTLPFCLLGVVVEVALFDQEAETTLKIIDWLSASFDFVREIGHHHEGYYWHA